MGRSSVFWVLLGCSLLWLAAAQDKRYVFFGKFKWGQDNEHLYITVYCPGVSVADAKVNITDSHFSITGASTTEPGKEVDIEFEFREDVMSSNVTIQQWHWKAGRASDSILLQIPKALPHYFDRLTFAPYTKEFKKSFEIDWNRYKRNEEDEDDLNDEEPDEEDWEDEETLKRLKNIKKLSDKDINKTLAKADLMVVHATYPWCRYCKEYEPFIEASRRKQLKKVLFGSLDARENKITARQLQVPCSKPQLPPNAVDGLTGCNQSIYIAKGGEWIGNYDSMMNDTDPDRMVRYLQAMSGPFPKPVGSFKDLQQLRKDYSDTTAIPVGLFDPVKDADAFELYNKYATARRASGRLFAVVDTSKLDKVGLSKLMSSVLPDLASEIQTPAIVLIKNYAETSANIPHLFSGGLNPDDEWTEDGVTDFLERNKYRLLSHYGKESHDQDSQTIGDKTLSRRGLPVAHLYLASTHGQADLMKKVQQAALKLNRKLAFVYHDQAKEDGVPPKEMVIANASEQYRNELLHFGFNPAERPFFGIKGNGAAPLHNHHMYSMPRTLTSSIPVTDLVEWCEAVLAGKVERAHKSQPTPATAAANQVQQIVYNTFVEHVMNSSSGIFLNMFNDQSAMHKAHTPELKKLAVALEAAGAKIQVLQYDWNNNELPEAARELEMIKRFTPVGTSLHFFLPGNEGGKKVFRLSSCDNGDCSTEVMVKFIHEHAPKNERFDLEKALKEVEHWDQFNPRPYSARCGIGEEPCKQGYTCEFSICYRPELSFDLSEPLRESVLADEEPEGGEESAKEL